MTDLPIDPNQALTLTVLGLGAIGVLNGVNVIVDWLKLLLGLTGQAVRWLVMGVATFVVVTLVLTQYEPKLSNAFTIVFLICYVSGLADARHQQVTHLAPRLEAVQEARQVKRQRQQRARQVRPDPNPPLIDTRAGTTVRLPRTE